MMVEGVYGGLGDGVLAEEFDNFFFWIKFIVLGG